MKKTGILLSAPGGQNSDRESEFDDGEDHGVAQRLLVMKGHRSISEFAKVTGVKQGVLRKYLMGSQPGLDKAAAIARAGGVNLEWLASGVGPMRPSQKLMASDAVDGRDDLVNVPLVAASASAGLGLIPIDGDDDGEMRFSARWLRNRGLQPRATAALLVQGDSMLRPDGSGIPSGALVLINTAVAADDVVTGCIYVLTRDEDLLIKRLERHLDGTLTLHSDNPRYRPEHVPPEMMDRVRIAGMLKIMILEL